MPLGILDDASFDASVESMTFDTSCQLIMASDGLVEAENETGRAFGEAAALQAITDARPSVRLRNLRAAVHGHLAGRLPNDDISILLVNCELQALATASPLRPLAPSAKTDQHGCDVRLSLSARELREHDVVPALCNLLKELGVAPSSTSLVFVVLSELYNNALDHGLLGMESSLKEGAQGFDQYVAERARRLNGLAQGSIEITARYIEAAGKPSLQIGIRHTGTGFEFARYFDANADVGEQPHGRGISLLRSVCTRLEYRDEGREAEVVLPLA